MDMDSVEEQTVTRAEETLPLKQIGGLTASERSELEFQRALAKLPPGSALFKALKRSRRSVRVFKHHAMYWPTGRELTESGRSRRG
jgi:hypothetical protein